jgi:hypothetical protein
VRFARTAPSARPYTRSRCGSFSFAAQKGFGHKKSITNVMLFYFVQSSFFRLKILAARTS